MLKFELNIGKIKSSYENQLKIDENFILNYAKRINYFGSVVVSNIESQNILKGICGVTECDLMMNSPKLETIRAVLRKGVRRVIIPEKEVEDISQKASKNIIIAKITLQNNSLLANNLNDLKAELKERVNRMVPYCSEILIDYDKDLIIDESTFLAVIDYISDFINYPITFLDAQNKFTEILEKKGINPFVCSSEMFEEKKMLEIFKSSLNFQKLEGLIPTIVQDEHNQIFRF